ncbi:MAG: iron ABC transporter permease, partial [Eubacterium sp.]
MKKILRKYTMPLSIVGCLLLIYFSTISGITSIPFNDANRILLHEILRIPVNMDGIAPGNIAIIWNVRLPRVILGFLTGGALAVCGASYQGIFKNPMADPFILGVSSGAALGAAIGIVCHLSGSLLGLNGTALLAFLGAFLTIILVYNISRVGRKVPVASLLLSGIAVGQFMSLIMIFNVQNMNQIMFWTMGSLNGKGWNQVFIVLPYIIIGMIILFTSLRELDIMLLGEDAATQLGVNTEFLKKKVLIASSI